MKEIEKYLESQGALDENGKPDESLFGVKMYKSLKAAKSLENCTQGLAVIIELTGVQVFY